MSDLGIYGLEFENVIVIFEISALEFSLLQSLVWKWKSLILGPKMPYLGFCRLTFERKLLLYLKQPRILQNAKLHAKSKILKFGTKYALFGYFWAEILKKHCDIWSQRPRMCLLAMFRAKIKILKFGTKNGLFGCFGQQCWKNVIFEINPLELIFLQS